MEEDNRKLILVSSDGVKEEISLKAGSRSVVIQTLLEINPDSNEIPLIKIKSNIVKKVKEYLEHYENIEPKVIERPLPEPEVNEETGEVIDKEYKKVCILLSLTVTHGIIRRPETLSPTEFHDHQNHYCNHEGEQCDKCKSSHRMTKRNCHLSLCLTLNHGLQ